jgi:hypothetical protein
VFPLLCPDSTHFTPVNSQLTGVPKAASHREIVMELKLALGQRPGERITATSIKPLDTSVTHRDVHTPDPKARGAVEWVLYKWEERRGWRHCKGWWEHV